MGKFHDLTGYKFGRLTVIERAPQTNPANRNVRWLCICECGNESTTTMQKLTSGHTKSCGCLRHEAFNAKHGQSGGIGKRPSATYQAWLNMRSRCLNPKSTGFANWGGRGITVCKRWNDFANFLADMGEKPGRDYELDRTDVNGHYEPANCQWIKRRTGQRRTFIMVDCNGRRMSLGRAAFELGLDYFSLHRLVYQKRIPFDQAVARIKARTA